MISVQNLIEKFNKVSPKVVKTFVGSMDHLDLKQVQNELIKEIKQGLLKGEAYEQEVKLIDVVIEHKLLYLTQYSEGGIYSAYQIKDINEWMGLSDVNDIQVSASAKKIVLSNKLVEFVFKLSNAHDSHNVDYYCLESITQHLKPTVGAKVILSCHGIDSIWRQGDIATISRDTGASGLWATFKNGDEYNIGFHRANEPDFIIIESQ